MALTSWNDILNKPAALEQVDELALEVSQLSSSVLTISGDVQELELSVADLSASVLTIGEDVNKLKTKLNIYGYLPCFVTSGKNVVLSFPLQGDINYNHVELSKTSGIAVDIYGDKGAVATTFSTVNISIANKVLYISGEISDNIETFVTLNRIQCIFIKETVISTLSNVTSQETKKKTTKKK